MFDKFYGKFYKFYTSHEIWEKTGIKIKKMKLMILDDLEIFNLQNTPNES